MNSIEIISRLIEIDSSSFTSYIARRAIAEFKGDEFINSLFDQLKDRASSELLLRRYGNDLIAEIICFHFKSITSEDSLHAREVVSKVLSEGSPPYLIIHKLGN